MSAWANIFTGITSFYPGVHGKRHVTTHGVALNCNTDMQWFSHIVPCGIEGKRVTSLSLETEQDVTVSAATQPLLDAFAEVFECDLFEENIS